jgi:hypothetical protein
MGMTSQTLLLVEEVALFKNFGEKNMGTGPAGLESKSDCVGEIEQQFTTSINLTDGIECRGLDSCGSG